MVVRSVLIVVCIGLSACSDPDVCDQMEMTLTIKSQAGQPASTFSVGDTVTFESRLTNRGVVPQTIEVIGCGLVDYDVLDENGNDVLPEPLASCAGMPPVTLGPGDFEQQVRTWDMDDSAAPTPVPAGSYEVIARDTTECAPALTESKTITVVSP